MEKPARRILVAEDEAPLRLLCRINLELAGMIVDEAVDGEAVLAAAREEPPDLILMDGMLPGIDGWTVAEALLTDPRTSEIPIVFLSARAERASQARAFEIGAVGYITKPFDVVGLAPMIERVIDQVERGEMDELRRAALARFPATT